jgi:SSS family solute:Na+ symporter
MDLAAKTVTVRPLGAADGVKPMVVPFGGATEIIRNGAPVDLTDSPAAAALLVQAPIEGQADIVRPRLVSFLRAGKAVDKIIPMYIAAAMPAAFGALFLVGMLAAGMSTLSSQIHTMGTALGHDVYRSAFGGDREKSLAVNRIAMFVTILGSTILAWYLPILLEKQGVEIIARGTSIFFGLCAAAFLPLYVLGLFTRFVTRSGAIAGLLAGTISSGFWITFIHAKSASALGLCKWLTGAASLIEAQPWPVVDPILVGLPISLAVTILVSLFSKKTPAEHLALCFEGKGATTHPVPTIDEVLDPEAEDKGEEKS